MASQVVINQKISPTWQDRIQGTVQIGRNHRIRGRNSQSKGQSQLCRQERAENQRSLMIHPLTTKPRLNDNLYLMQRLSSCRSQSPLIRAN
jgi:hypothetical protein